MRLLFVEDFRPLRRLLAEELNAACTTCQVVGEAATGEEGVVMAVALEPDVVIMDFRLPGIDGAVATSRILADAPEIEVIGFVGSPQDADALLASGASRVFFKEDLDRLVSHLAEREE
jgi:DNA-binding NarL/FixJ family response regulator